jgi:hypothetical protein
LFYFLSDLLDIVDLVSPGMSNEEESGNARVGLI